MSGRTLTSVDALVGAGLLPPERRAGADAVAARYAIALTPVMAGLIDSADPSDPIAAQFLPDPRELHTTKDESADPIGDHAHEKVKGLIHRYPDRVLMKAVHVCPVYCRFCFRREMVGPSGDGMMSEAEIEAALAYVSGHPEIWEVILTGGDPLILSPRRLGELVSRIAAIPHVRILRLHSRVPLVDPDRIGAELVDALTASRLRVVVAVHGNHVRELTQDGIAALGRLSGSGVMLVSQTVLLKGINDRAETLAALMRGFVEAGVKPYYLHHPDRAPGTAHRRLGIEDGRAIVEALRRLVSGIAMPAYVIDLPGGYGKVPLSESPVMAVDGGHEAIDRHGGRHRLASD